MLTARTQHNQFQNYLKKEKEIVSRKLRSKIFPSTELDDYEFLEILGQGSYGKVVTAQNIHTNKVFAIKIIQKKYLVKEERLKHLISEIRILNSINFEFLISLECYFTNECFVFLVLPWIRGAHFFKLLRTVTRFEESTAKFFAGQIVLAIEYLHYMGIVYRDLKPENLLLDLQGYLKLIDYGFAKKIDHNYSYSFCGTPEYLAPEILLNKGHNLSPDWWTLGILLYEMCSGLPPFTSRNEMRLFEKIVAGNINCPEYFSKELKSLVTGLLQVDKSKRLGCKKQKVADIKFHKWFSQIDWMALLNKKISSPITPNEIENSSNEGSSKTGLLIKNCITVPSKMIGNIDFMI